MRGASVAGVAENVVESTSTSATTPDVKAPFTLFANRKDAAQVIGPADRTSMIISIARGVRMVKGGNTYETSTITRARQHGHRPSDILTPLR